MAGNQERDVEALQLPEEPAKHLDGVRQSLDARYRATAGQLADNLAVRIDDAGKVHLSPLEAKTEALAARFKALADPNRLRILSIVSTSPEAETCVCDLSEPLSLGQPIVSHHLKILVEACLLNREKRGVWAYYSLVPGAMDPLAAILTPKA